MAVYPHTIDASKAQESEGIIAIKTTTLVKTSLKTSKKGFVMGARLVRDTSKETIVSRLFLMTTKTGGTQAGLIAN
jgi:hypothetical protein